MPSKGTTTQRGYGTAHQRERKKWERLVDAGMVDCVRCHEPIEPGRPWDLGHNDERTAWTGPEHVSCNRSAGGANGAAVANAMRGTPVRQSQEW